MSNIKNDTITWSISSIYILTKLQFQLNSQTTVTQWYQRFCIMVLISSKIATAINRVLQQYHILPKKIQRIEHTFNVAIL